MQIYIVLQNVNFYFFQLKDFTEKVQETTPKLPKKESTGRNEFSSIKDLVDYCIKGGKG